MRCTSATVDAGVVTIMKDGKVIDRIIGIGGRPHGVTMDTQGHIYVSDPVNQTVKQISKMR